MDKQTLFNSIDGLMAYDLGATDSGINDEITRVKVKEYLFSLDESRFRILLSEYIRQYFVSEEVISEGYGIEDVAEFIRWLSESMEIDI